MLPLLWAFTLSVEGQFLLIKRHKWKIHKIMPITRITIGNTLLSNHFLYILIGKRRSNKPITKIIENKVTYILFPPIFELR